ncbi:hypothetical protein F4808DRAFT_60045 [Astrocystis sublimbata]|nr:hypothetical protein F4808DRAFT_60045 [Astrocystis sublimbata]
MTQTSWAQGAINRFFGGRKSPSQMQCDTIAQSISGASKVSPVDSPGSMSYTVVCNGCPGPQQDLIVSFREPGAMLDEGMVKLAKEIHGDLVPQSTCHGYVNGADPSLSIYSMPYLYFARCWANPQPLNRQTQSRQQEGIRRRLARLAEELPSSILPNSVLSKLIENIPSLFSQDYPQVLTHDDFSVTNILVDENKFEITGIVDWSLATVMPFGMDLDILFLTTGFMTRDGWHDYACKLLLQENFWDEFWVVSGIEGEDNRGRTQSLAEAACKISAILRLAFRRNADGSPSEEVLVSESSINQLRAWFGERAANKLEVR